MVNAHRNEGIAPLDSQIKTKWPGVIIGWIGDRPHQAEVSAHNPNSAGRVNAIDVMIGPHFTWADAVWLSSMLAGKADKRLNNIIFNRRIWDDANGKWRNYSGMDPHTGHTHIEVHDSAHTNTSAWDLGEKVKRLMLTISGTVPAVREGDDDKEIDHPFKIITRLQLLHRIPDDGIWGKQTTKSVGSNVLTAPLYKKICGMV